MANFASTRCYAAPHLRRSKSALSVAFPAESKGAEQSPRIEEFYDASALLLPERLSTKVSVDETNKSIEGELHFANVTPRNVFDVISNFENYSEQHDSVVRTEIKETSEGLLVTMTTKVAGITDTLPLMHTIEENGSSITISWQLQEGEKSRFLNKNQGSFTIKSDGTSGTIVEHRLALSPRFVP